MAINNEMLFERTMQSLFGDKAFHIAGQVHTESTRKKWYKKAIIKIIKDIQEIETNTRHKEILAHYSEGALNALAIKPFNEYVLTLNLLRLISAFLGYAGTRSYKVVSPAYFQTPAQQYTQLIMEGGDTDLTNENTISAKIRLIKQLKEEGLSYFKISLILNISEYEVKKLREQL